jgi:hypothetical protein
MSATTTMRRPKRSPQTVRQRRAIDAAERAQVRVLIVRLFQQGQDVDSLAILTGYSLSQVRRILLDAGAITETGTDDETLLTPAELRECRRENASSPEALAWLATQQSDRRHNGRVMPRIATYSDPSLDDEDDDESLSN